MTISKLLVITGLLGIVGGSSPTWANDPNSCPNFEEKIRKCMALHGSEAQRSRNMAWRKAHLPAMIQEDYGFTLIYLDESIERPIAAQMNGIRLMRVLSEGQLEKVAKCPSGKDSATSTAKDAKSSGEKLWAEVRLPEQFQELCGLSMAYLELDDHLGAENQVISVAPEGVLLKSGPGLFWISVQPANFFPEFRMVWQSSYRVAPTISHSSSGSSRKVNKRSPKRKKASKRKKR